MSGMPTLGEAVSGTSERQRKELKKRLMQMMSDWIGAESSERREMRRSYVEVYDLNEVVLAEWLMLRRGLFLRIEKVYSIDGAMLVVSPYTR